MLLYITLIVFLMAGIAVFIMKTTFWMISKLGHNYIEMTHRSAEYIINTGAVPPFWYKQRKPKYPPLVEKLRCLKKLRKLISYFKNSTISGDEDSRTIIISKLTDINNQWIDKDWSQLEPGS